jgi:hypothetical protein
VGQEKLPFAVAEAQSLHSEVGESKEGLSEFSMKLNLRIFVAVYQACVMCTHPCASLNRRPWRHFRCRVNVPTGEIVLWKTDHSLLRNYRLRIAIRVCGTQAPRVYRLRDDSQVVVQTQS